MLMSEFVVISIDNLPRDRVSTTRPSSYVPCLFLSGRPFWDSVTDESHPACLAVGGVIGWSGAACPAKKPSPRFLLFSVIDRFWQAHVRLQARGLLTIRNFHPKGLTLARFCMLFSLLVRYLRSAMRVTIHVCQ